MDEINKMSKTGIIKRPNEVTPIYSIGGYTAAEVHSISRFKV